MVKKIESSDQVDFLVACIKHSNNGKPDFGAVAEELNIVSKAAAQKRYERMLKAHQVAKMEASKADDGGLEPEDAPKSPVKRRKASATGASRKKVKQEDGQEESATRKAPKARTRVKNEPKAEEDGSEETSESAKSLDGEI
ncbi:hypothetical protein CDD81_3303 [Ophiocordyceps australis]|uniref:Myb-like DNA-binding domain-containing protein n=1 Tax=Ophiocordyceps australis TaxID=1399860 RepID=A0A2C5YD22_9HYPO|nr:hypothetical protein CDD81_3303 [Ophiocordyceps australis]